MLKSFICLMLCAPFILLVPSHALQIFKITGNVAAIDVEGGVVDVQIGGNVETFKLTSISELFMNAHHMSSVEIALKDPVIITYTTNASGTKEIIRLVDIHKDI